MSTVASNRKGLVEVTARDLRAGDRDGSLMVGRQIVAVGSTSDGRVELSMQWSRTGRKDRAVVDPDRTFRVRRATVGSGLALRYQGTARLTGRTVEVWDTSHPESDITASAVRGHRWAMRCEHGTVIGRPTLERAREDVADPRLWCLSCVETMPGALPLPL